MIFRGTLIISTNLLTSLTDFDPLPITEIGALSPAQAVRVGNYYAEDQEEVLRYIAEAHRSEPGRPAGFWTELTI